jgi:tripartite-type tricarboxylate transporter receptor subunit TctC
MNLVQRGTATGMMLALAVLAAQPAAHAQYPSKRVTLVVPFAAGGSNDILARAIGQKLSEEWRIPVVIENQVGASGALGAARVAKAEPDGHTLLIVSSTYTINAAVQPSPLFDAKSSFAAAAMLGKAPMMLAAAKRVPVRATRDLIDMARAKPGELNYGSAGIGSVNHVAMELFKSLAGLDIKHVPYRSGNAAVNDLVAGHLDMFVGSLPQMIELVRANTATGIGVTGTKRSSALPDLPTLAESGVPAYELEQWWGIVAPAGTPAVIVGVLNAELNRVLATPEIRTFMTREGAEATPSTADAFGQYLAAELQRWNELVKRMGIKAE